MSEFTKGEIKVMLALLQSPDLSDSGVSKVIQRERDGKVGPISERTVQSHIGNLFKKTGFNNKTELLRAITNKEINLEELIEISTD